MKKNVFKELRFVDLFAGVGGFRIAFEELGHKCVFSSELNNECKKVYKRNFKDTPFGDINNIKSKDIPDFDILTSGFPCQPFSLNGLKRGFSDKKGGTLFFNIAEIIKQKKPKMFLLENVKGILTNNNGETINAIQTTLDDLGYTIYSSVLNTYNFGIPQYRERWYCVGFNKPIGFNFPVRNDVGSKIKSVIDFKNNDKELILSKRELSQIDFHFKNYKKTKRVKHSNSHCDPNSKKGKYGIYSYLKPDKSLRFHMGDKAKSQIQDDYYVSIESVAPTLIATRAPKLWDLKRKLSVNECKRLQSFPEHFSFEDVSINTAKKQLGNAVNVKVVKLIIKNMINYYNKNIHLHEKNFPNRYISGDTQGSLF